MGLRLLMVTQDYPPAVGGIQTYAHALARCFSGRADALCVLAPEQRGAAAFDAGQPHRVERVRTPSDLMRVAVLPALLRVARRERLDTVFTGHWYVAAAALAARAMGAVRHVYVAAHGQELLSEPVPRPLRPLYRRHRQQVLRGADGLFAVSQYTAGLARADGVAAQRIHVVPNGTELERFDHEAAGAAGLRFRAEHGIPPGPLLATVCRLVDRKGVDLVLRALPRLARAHPGVRYVVAGEGPARERLERFARELGVHERCHFLGRVEPEVLVALYHACDVYVMAARQSGASVEGFGLVFREANACGKAVVGTRTGGIPDAILDGVTGLLVPPEDVDALAEALLALLGDRALAERLGRQGHALVAREGTWVHAADRILAAMQAGS
jgi:phosphatidylinositol alpha-1,6-mannosyltransferase